MGNKCRRLNSVDIKNDNTLENNINDKINNLNKNMDNLNKNLNNVIEKLNKLEKINSYIKDRLDEEFPKKEIIPIAESFDVFKINDEKITIPSYYSPEEKMKIINEHKNKIR